MSTQIILLESVEHLGQMGDVVAVKPGYARNFLLPQGKALRATKSNVAYFETQKKVFEAENLKKKKEAEAVSKKMDGLKVVVIRNASESGQLYGSVTSSDITDSVCSAGFKIAKSQVQLNQNLKTIGLTPVTVALHPEVKISVTLNIARSEEEAKIQEKTGKALLSTEEEEETASLAESDEIKAEFLEDTALEAEKEQADLEAEKQREADAKAELKAAEKAEKEAAKNADDETTQDTSEDASEEKTEDASAE